jgi:hypothetical protein
MKQIFHSAKNKKPFKIATTKQSEIKKQTFFSSVKLFSDLKTQFQTSPMEKSEFFGSLI